MVVIEFLLEDWEQVRSSEVFRVEEGESVARTASVLGLLAQGRSRRSVCVTSDCGGVETARGLWMNYQVRKRRRRVSVIGTDYSWLRFG
jgi:hypothetical protein